MSKSAQASIDFLIIFRCLNFALAGKNPVYHRLESLRFQGKDFGLMQLLRHQYGVATRQQQQVSDDYSNLLCCTTAFNPFQG